MSPQNSFANASPSSSTIGASTTSTSAVRSRPRRLVSFMDDEDDSNNLAPNYSYQNDSQPFSSGSSTTLAPLEAGTARSRGASPSPLSSRGASPLPMTRPSRASESVNSGTRNVPTSFTWNGFSKASSSGGAADFLDSPWSSLQSLASSVLGSDAGRASPTNGTKRHTRRKPSRSDVYIKSPPRSTWGPSAPTGPQVGTGTKEERQALVQEKKREALLLADSDSMASRTNLHKRRDSGDTSQQAFEPDPDEDALAYIHKVQPTDTITGVTIKYGCHAAVFRKANGFWPNDNIQSRNTVLLPVDACSVKGRPVLKEPVDLLGSDKEEDLSDSSIVPVDASAKRTYSDQETSATETKDHGKHAWKHESWVQMDGFPGPVEIGRVPRRALGFFPRTRRKSTPYSDAEPPDLYRQKITPASPAGSPPPSSFDILPRSRPNGGQATTTRPQHRRQRSSIHLSGTGVGTLDRTSTGPGPALDGFTRFFAQHMPALAPPKPPDNVQRGSFESASTMTSNASTGLENIGGAFEGWVRKVATRAKAGINELQQGTPNAQSNSRGRNTWRMDDLIELDDGMAEGRNSPSPLKTSRRPDLQGSSSSSSSIRYNSPSVVAASRSRATGFGSGSGAAYGERAKDD
ncbi:uncharacterized protein N7515_001824 [Penicillium bovifimosum]|uniref:LysM domain-containing protein n=1 Tax=Penicillium bovifimosum TaxID=126998 RepID=A0A9W9HAE3_9EURO|nr:uncharacterized protein N7515_001824 [Penicillium bovifimosum]KAJ5143037.1 hypothetical protein N7515_001824 [Penicillium bovifimosum]